MQVIISDLHFGDRKGCDLLRYKLARQRLMPLLAEADELVLLGDVWDLTFQSFRVAVACSAPFFTELAQRNPAIRIRIIPGNHDHHLVVKTHDERREAEALGRRLPDLYTVPPAERIIAQLAPSLRVDSSYPVWTSDDIWYHHGHYLSSHLESFGWKTFARLQRLLSGSSPDGINMTPADYEAMIGPVHELWYQIAQLPTGVQRQIALEDRLLKATALFNLPKNIRNYVFDTMGRIQQLANSDKRNEQRKLVATMTMENDLRALEHVLNNLDVTQQTVIIGHTHQPHACQVVDRWNVYNTGGWFLDYRVVNSVPGSALINSDGAISLVQLLTTDEIESMLFPMELETPDHSNLFDTLGPVYGGVQI